MQAVRFFLFAALLAQASSASSQAGARTRAPRIWDEMALQSWANPMAGINLRPHHYSEAEYYAAPVDNLRSYPAYHPDREPAGYLESLRKRGPEPMLELGKARTRDEWIEAGRRVWDELDVARVRTSDFRIIDYLRSREALKKYPQRMTKDGRLIDFRWVVENGGELKLGLTDCSSCHSRVMPDGSVVSGSQANFQPPPFAPMLNLMFGLFSIPKEPGGELPAPGEAAYASFGVPWLSDDVHRRLPSLAPRDVGALTGAEASGTFARFNGSSYFTTKIPSLIGVRYSRYLDHTGTHQNRGPEDIARYAALVSTADDGSIGPYKFLTDYQRRLRLRLSDDALYALGVFIYFGMQEPPNPNPPGELSRQGEKIFARAGCAGCHTPPAYTNGMLIPADGFTPPDDAETKRLAIIRGVRIGSDPGLALKTRKGTGYYKVPSLRGLWHRDLIEHSGSIASLEDWFDPKRLRPEFVPSGWKGPGVERRAVPGHEFGLDLPAEDKRALIAFLRTL